MTAPRTSSLLGLTAHLACLRPRVAALFGLTLAGVLALSSCPRSHVDIATFNIRDFPETEAQIDGAFETIAALDVPIVAVEEITDPTRFIQGAHQYLGPTWRAEFGPTHDFPHSRRRVGLLFDSARYGATATRLHPQPGTNGPGRPVLEVRLEPTQDRDTSLRVFVVHLKSGGDSTETRTRQLRALTSAVRKAVASSDEIVVLGDFNSTGETDRANLALFAANTGLEWATEELTCTAYWKPQGKCTGSALDHVFTSKSPRAATARGPCETEGCEPGDACPVFFDLVSDHCPVTASF